MAFTRRILLTAAAAAAASSLLPPANRALAAAPFAQPPLPYPTTALAPVISARTVGLHYGKHHKGYFDKLNGLVTGTAYAGMTLEAVVAASKGKDDAIFNNAGQAWNHVIYWEAMNPEGARQPGGALAAAIRRDFGGFDAFKAAFVKAAGGVFGTGWVWLTHAGGRLEIVGYRDADNPLAYGKPALLGIDVWEHAYYLDYENRRGDHVRAVLDQLVDWAYVDRRLAAP